MHDVNQCFWGCGWRCGSYSDFPWRLIGPITNICGQSCVPWCRDLYLVLFLCIIQQSLTMLMTKCLEQHHSLSGQLIIVYLGLRSWCLCILKVLGWHVWNSMISCVEATEIDRTLGDYLERDICSRFTFSDILYRCLIAVVLWLV